VSTATDHGYLSATLLLHASVIDDPHPFYRRLVAEAPVWRVPDTEIVIVSSYSAVTEVVSRVDDFSSNLHAILYRGALGVPALFPFPADGLQTLAIADPPVHAKHRSTVFPELVARRMAA
jgi:cytochrome P450